MADKQREFQRLSAEAGVLGDLLISPEVLPILRGGLTADDFRTETGARLFRAACAIADRGETLDVTTLRAALPDVEDGYFLALMDATPTAAHVEAHVEALRLETVRSGLTEAMDQAKDALLLGRDPREVLETVQARADAIADHMTRQDLVDGLTALSGYWQEIGKKQFLPTGYRAIDDVLGGGFIREGLYILAARPGVGKTMLALQIAEGCGKPVLFVSLEMSLAQLSARRIAAETGINSAAVLTGTLTPEERARISKVIPVLAERPICFNRRPWATVEDIRHMARKVKDLGLVVVDYLGLIRHTEGKTLYEKTTATSNALKRTARSLGVPVLCLAQLNRDSVKDKGAQRPRISDLRDSGAVAQDADGLLLLHNPRQEQEAGNDGFPAPEPLECIIGKNRHGRTGRVTLNFYKTNGRIREVYTRR